LEKGGKEGMKVVEKKKAGLSIHRGSAAGREEESGRSKKERSTAGGGT